MHILFLTDNFPPEVNAPASRTFEHCREWVRAGHRVTVITCAPNFPKGKVFAGYRNKMWQAEEMDGIRVIRVWSYITANEGFARRVLDYVSFMVAAVPAALFVRRVDVVIGTSPQFFTVCAAFLVGTLKRVPWIFELRDIWPESIRAVGAMRQSVALDLLEKVEMFLYRKADAIVSVTNSFRDTLIRRGVDGAKITVVTNGVDGSRFTPRPKDEPLLARHGLQGKFVAGYIGTHGMAHALDTLLDAAREIQTLPNGEGYRFLLLGDGANKAALQAQASSLGLKNLAFFDPVPKAQVPAFLAQIDVAYIGWQDVPIYRFGIAPNKLFDYMMAGKPVLHSVAAANDPVALSGCGLTVAPADPAAIAAGLRQLANMSVPERVAMGESGRPYVLAHHTWPVLAQRVVDALA